MRFFDNVDYYKILNINPEASINEIEAAKKQQLDYVYATKKSYIDKKASIAMIEEAYEVLSDYKLKNKYDSAYSFNSDDIYSFFEDNQHANLNLQINNESIIDEYNNLQYNRQETCSILDDNNIELNSKNIEQRISISFENNHSNYELKVSHLKYEKNIELLLQEISVKQNSKSKFSKKDGEVIKLRQCLEEIKNELNLINNI